MDLHDYYDVAENYDIYSSGLTKTEMIDFHLDLALQYGTGGILDIACGTGFTLIPLIQAGYQVTGIDISEAMLTMLKRKLVGLTSDVRQHATIVCSNMTDFQLQKRASLAIIPRSGFMHLPTPADEEEALKNIHRHLLPGGILSFNTFDPDYVLIAGNLKGTDPPPKLRFEYINGRGHSERVWAKTEFDPANQWMEGSWTFEELDGKGNIIEQRVRPLKMRYSFETEMRHLLRLCGFEVVNIYASYGKALRAGYGAGNLIWVVRRVEGIG